MKLLALITVLALVIVKVLWIVALLWSFLSRPVPGHAMRRREMFLVGLSLAAIGLLAVIFGIGSFA